MKVLVIASYAPSLVTFRGALIRSLIDVGCEVLLVAPSFDEKTFQGAPFLTSEVTLLPIPMRRAGVNPLVDLKYLCSLFVLMIRLKPRVVLAYTVKPVVWGLFSAALARVPRRFALITGLGYAFNNEKRGVVGFIVPLLYRFSLLKVDKVFFQNADDEALFRKQSILRRKTPSVVVNGSGIDLAEFLVSTLPCDFVFLLIARLIGDKGVREYIAAARQIKAIHPRATFKLVGWIDENPDAIQQDELDAWVNEGVVDYLGKLSDVRPAIREAAVYVLPSYREGTPRTVLEAMAMGRPIITTDAPGCRETVIDGENGFLVPVKDVDALAQAMLRFIEEPELIASMGKRSREIAEEKYDVNKVNAVMLREMGL